MAKQNRISLFQFVNPSRNYLIVVAAMVVVVCLTFGLAFILASSSLDSGQRWLFILFLIAFPVIGLSSSVWLILRHSRKLSVNNNDSQIEWRIMSAEKQQQKLNSEVADLARVLKVPEDQMSDLRSAYIVAEDLALRHVEKENQIPLLRHITLGNTEFDAVLIDRDVIKCIEVTFLVTPNIAQEKINSILKKTETLKNVFDSIRPHTKLILMPVLVTQLDQKAEFKLRSLISGMFADTPVDVDIRLFDFEDLQKVFTAE